MQNRRTINIIVSLSIVTLILLGNFGRPAAAPSSPIGGSKVPHYFGPEPNWALSPLTTADVTVAITGDGTGATATATIGGDGAVTSIAVTNPGVGYTFATVDITGGGTLATADAVITPTGAVTSISVDTAGNGYTAPTVSITGGGAVVDATATAFGGVDMITLVDPGSGYSFPTVDIDAPDAPDGVQATAHVNWDPATSTFTAVIVDNHGSGYATAPSVLIRDGTVFDPINNGGAGAIATATLTITSVNLDTFGAGYTSVPTVTISDPTGTLAAATATFNVGVVSAINVTAAGSGYLTTGGIKKFTDPLPGICIPGNPAADCPTTGKYIPIGVPELKVYTGANGLNPIEGDEYVIGLVQYRTSFSSSLPSTLVRGYVQIETPANAAISQHFPLTNANVDPTKADTPIFINGAPAFAVTPPQWLGPTILATKDKPVRIVFHNLLPIGSDGDLFLPVDSTLMGSGMIPEAAADPLDEGLVTDAVRNPVCSEYPKDPSMCFTDNRATLHLHGGTTPWISDGTPHQWITPAGETTTWPQGVAVENVPDMNVCNAADDGCQTFYYTNQQSARLLFYHDHSWGITRLNVYAGEAAGYLISDAADQKLFGSAGLFPELGTGTPLIIQDRTFVPDDAQLLLQDPTWDTARWGTKGSFWYHHVYMSAQNPGDPSGMSAYGRWMYGPWFWPPASGTIHGPIDNPYYVSTCKLDVPSTWTYQTDPFCEPKQIPGTPNISTGMEQFNDTPIVNGVAYPTLTLEPKAYRLRVLNAANDRFFNFQWYVGDPTTASTGLNTAGEPIGATEVALKTPDLLAAQTDPNVSPNPDTTVSLPGPDWVVIGSEGGFLPAPAVVDGQQFTTWITDPTRFDVGNVDKHSLLLAPAERSDVIVDFSQFAGQTLILYNDAPAAFPARVPSYDYYTGAPDMSPNGAPGVLPGYGPNTRTIMQVKIAAAVTTPVPAFSLAKLQTAFKHTTAGTGVFESSQHPIIVGQAAYNSAYGTSFAGGSNCNAPGSILTACDGLVRVSDTSEIGFNTLRAPTIKSVMPLQPKAIHDEMNSSTFDEFGRMQANLGIEAQPPTPGLQNVTLYPYINPSTELIDGTNLPKAHVIYDASGLPVSDVKMSPISTTTDGSQIWRITHNGVDTHPIHFHLFDVQVLNRVTWDNIIIPTEATELGWKDTVRISPLEDTIVALRPIIPEVPFEVPNSIRPLSPMMPTGATTGFNNIDPQGNPTLPIVNQLVNFGWEYVYHCHILSHEEMDMMRPVSLALPPIKPDGLVSSFTGNGNNRRIVITWNDNSKTETSFVLQRSTDGTNWTDIATSPSPLDQPNGNGTRKLTDTTSNATRSYLYRVAAVNTVGYGAEFPTLAVRSVSTNLVVNAPAAPTNLSAGVLSGPQVRLAWTDNATNETGFAIERATNGGAFVQIATPGPRNNTGGVTFTDTTVVLGSTYSYRVAATGVSLSAFTNTATILVAVPAAPSNLNAFPRLSGGSQRVDLSWTDNSSSETGFTIQWSSTAAFTTVSGALSPGANATSVTTGNIARQLWFFRIRANNVLGSSAWVATGQITPASLVVSPVHSPLIFSNDFTLGIIGWSGQLGNVKTDSNAAMGDSFGQGMTSTWGDDEVEATEDQPSYVFHFIPNALGSYTANFDFNPNGAVTSATPVDIFTGLDANGVEIFGIQYLHTASAPNVYQIRSWAKMADDIDVYSNWVSITNAEQNLQLDWQSSATSSLNLYVGGVIKATVNGDTSLNKLYEERLGPSRGVAAIDPAVVGTVYLDEFVSVSAEIASPFTPVLISNTFLPLMNR